MGLDATMKRMSPAIIAVMIAIIAYFQAVGVGRLVVTAVSAPEAARHPLPHAPRPPAPQDHDHATSAAAILARNPFDSVTGPLVDKGVAPGAGPAEPAAFGHDPYGDPPCAGARVLLIAGAADPEWSFAVVAGADGKAVMRRKGEEIDGQKVYFVGDLRAEEHLHEGEGGVWDRVWLTSGATRCQLALGAKATAAAAPKQEAKPTGPTSPLADKVKQVGPNQYEIERSAVEQIIGNPAELMRVQAFPVKDGDRVLGLKLRGIKAGSLLGVIGIQNNDVLTSINGFEMNDPQKMIEAYTKLMKADRLTATVTRGGSPVNIDYRIK
jgi:general secretion pathway protein C